jgi:oligoribonuclease (3'-5' exoribonuclease)
MHRAADDIRGSIDELKYYLKTVAQAWSNMTQRVL